MMPAVNETESQGKPPVGNEQAERARYVEGRRAALVSIVGNALLAAAKLVLAVLTNSISLMADAAHTASDMVTSVVVWAGLRVGRRPADDEHPYGHGRAETVAALIVAVLLGVAGANLAWRGVAQIARPVKVGETFGGTGLLLTAGFILLTVLAKAWMGFYATRVGRRIRNQSLLADAWHHHSDALSSLLVIVALVLARWEVYAADGWLGLGVSAIIIYTGWHHFRISSSALMGEKPDAATVEAIESLARSVHGTKDVHAITVHDYGRRKVASLHITLLGGLSLVDAHRVASEVEGLLAARLGMSALVHAEPEGEPLPPSHLEEIRAAVQRLLIAHPGIVSFHALSLQPEDHGLEVEFHVHIPPGTAIQEAHRLEHEVTDTLTREFPEVHVHLHLEPCELGCVPCPESCGIQPGGEPAA